MPQPMPQPMNDMSANPPPVDDDRRRFQAALVTGAAKRIGRAMALDLASQGWAVAVHYNSSREEAESVADECRRLSGRPALALGADLADEQAVNRMAAAAVEALGPLGLLVNNASLFERDEVMTVSRESWDRHLDINLRAPFVLAQALARSLPEDGSGLVVNMLDQRVWNLTPHFMSYTLSKAGLWTLTQTLALALAPRVRVNAIGPGPTMRNERQTEDHFRTQWQAIPLQRPVDAADICAALRYFIAAKAVTGQMLAVDGGEHMGWAQPSRGFVATE